MKKFTLILVGFLFFFANNSIAQKPTTPTGDHKHQTYKRCGTDEAIERQMQTDPEFRAMMQKREQDYQNYVKANGSNNFAALARTSVLTGPVTIPVVVHIVLPNPEIITDADVDYFINRLNLDFSGNNPDSTNAVAFYGVRGRSLMRFQLARRDPSGVYTTGIERKIGAVAIGGGEPQAIKNAATGGLNPWPFQQYYNLWVGAGGGLLGIAPAIGVGTAASDGVCVGYEAFSNSNCGYTIPAFNLGRTAVHEIGHNFGLFHTFSGCSAGADFGQLTSAGCTLPANLLAGSDDTPTQGTPTSGCPSGSVASNCAGVANPPGKMYQNYMDYTDDACYSMFTKAQVERMHYVLEFCRGGGYLTTQGHLPPAGFPTLDAAAMAVVSPGGSELIGCTPFSYPAPACPGTFLPKVRIENRGSSTINSITVALSINAVVVATQTFTALNIATYKNRVVTFTAAQNLVTGANAIVYTLSAPNGGTDLVSTNNTASTSVTVGAPVASPVVQGFATATFPPAGWSLNQISGTGNWARVTTTGRTDLTSAKFDNYNYAAGTTSSLTSPSLTFANTFNAASVTFHYAYQSYVDAGTPAESLQDELDVQVSTNCGVTWTSLWRRVAGQLITATPRSAGTAFSGNPVSQWTANPINVNLTPYLNQTIQIRFVAKSDFGNNLYLDDINISGSNLPPNDASISAINTPLSAFCGSGFTPQVVVRNNGSATLTSVVVFSGVGVGTANPATYINQAFTGLSVPSGGTTTLTLNPVTGLVNGNFNFKSYTNLPNGLADAVASNDTLAKPFTANVATTTFPVVQTFETAWTGTATAPIPGAGWTVLNPNNNFTWGRSTLAARTGIASGMIDNYNGNNPGQLDYIVAPLVNFVGRDSAYVTFDYAYKLYAAADTDTLELVISTNCGTSWTSLWKKGGQELATAPGTAGAAFTPTATQWVNANVDLMPYVTAGGVYIALRNRNDFGQRLFIDNINIVGKTLPNNDAQLASIVVPGAEVCETSPTVSVTVRNGGKLVLNSVSAGYNIDGGANTTQVFTLTPPIPVGGSRTISFTTRPTLALGARVIRAFTFGPNGVPDENLLNDTLTKAFTVIQPIPAPLTEGFDGTTFPPTNWAFTEAPVNVTKWVRTTTASTNGIASAFMQNFNATAVAANSLDYLHTPHLSVAKADSVFFKFDVSAASRQYPGSTSTALDTLDVQATIDCGNNWVSVYKKWGENLQTINDPNATYTVSFVPNNANQWRTDSVNLTSLIAAGGNIRLRFLNTSNNGNNVYIDNVNLYSKNLSATLKTNGFVIAPNPVKDVVVLQHYLAPTNLRGVGFYNAAGQRLMYQSFNGNADSFLPFNISRFAAGIYSVKVEYTNKTVTQRIIKL